MQRPRAPRSLKAWAIALFCSAACSSGDGERSAPTGSPSSEAPRSEVPPAVETSRAEAAASSVVAGAPTFESLAPRIETVDGRAGIAHVEVRFERPVVGLANTRVTEKTDVRIVPDIPGQWSFSDRSTLRFVPRNGFRPDTEYVVSLRAIQSVDGATAIVGSRSVQRTFKTSPLRLDRLELTRWSPTDGRAEFDVVFTGAVRYVRSSRALRWVVDGIRRRVTIRRAKKPNVWVARLDERGLKAGSLIEVSVVSNRIESLVDRRIKATGSAQTQLPKDKAAFIRGVAVVEGADGFFLRVICHDEASEGRTQRFWDRDLRERFSVSPRCVLDETSAKAKLRLEPAIAYTISPTRGGFRVHAPFARGTVELSIDSGARTVDGGVTTRGFRRALRIPERRAKLEFVAQGRYLPSSAWGDVAIRHQNVREVVVRVRQVTRANVVRWLSESGEGTTSQNSDLVVEETLALEGQPDVLETSTLALKDFLPKPPPGVVEIQVVDKVGRQAQATVRFAVTDLNVLAKRQSDGAVRAWVLNAHDHRPIRNAKVQMVVHSGRQISACRTGADGGCGLEGIAKDAVDKAEPFALLATTDADYTFVRFDQLRLDTSGYDVHGADRRSSSPYRAATYRDRGVYRPGDTAHVVAIVRGNEDRAPPVGMPVQVELLDPRRKVSRRRALKTNEAGMVAVDFPFADFAATGRYEAVFKAAERIIGRRALRVEEFVPERMEVTVAAARSDYGADDDAEIEAKARYLFGGSAAGSRFDLRCALTPARFAPKQHRGYRFDVWRELPRRSVQLGQVSGALGAEGQGRMSCPPLAGRGRALGTMRLEAQVVVFEAGSGRTSRGQTTAIVHPSARYIGLKSDTSRVKTDRTFRVQGVVVGWDGALDASVAQVEVELHKIEREYGWVYDEREGRWTSRRHAHLVKTHTVQAAVRDGRFTVELKTPESAPAYVVRARAGDAIGDLQMGGSWGYWWYGYNYGGGDATPRPLKPESLSIAAPQDVSVGAPVEVGFESPYSGRVLWTVESAGVQKAVWQDVQPGPVGWSFKVDAFEPNVYVSALLLKDPHDESKASFLPSRAFGVTSIRVRPERFVQTATIRAPDEIRSNQPLEIEVDLPKAERPTFVTVAAVDEGILSLTNFKTPDPSAQLFARQRLGVGTFETIGWNISLPAGDIGRSTGGGGPTSPGRIQMVKPVALWSGLLEVPRRGPLKVRFDVPRYRGKLRIMVVGAGPERLVSASHRVLVRDPIVLQTTLPRFLVQGDAAQVPVFLTNLSGRAQKATVRLSSQALGPAGKTPDATGVVVRGPAVREVKLEKDGQATVIYRIEATAAVGGARLSVDVKAGDLSVSESLDVPFAPNAPMTSKVQRIVLEPGEVDLKPYLKGWLPTTESSRFWVTANPYAESLDHLSHLVRYPYGCLEQTTSATRPLLFADVFGRRLDPKFFSESKVEARVNRGLDRVLSMQTPSGGFGYWPGASRPVHWGTAYATHLLIDAKKKGYDVPQDRIDDAVEWIQRALSADDDRADIRSARAYMHYVSALGGASDKKADMLDQLNILQGRRVSSGVRDTFRDEQILLLQAALHVSGDLRFESQMLDVDVSAVESTRRNGWSFYSDRRRRGLTLTVLSDLFGARPELEPLAQRVADSLRGRRSGWYTTQELAWGITGLGKMLNKVTQSFPPPTLTGNGQAIAAEAVPSSTSGATDDVGDRTFSVYRASEYEGLVLTARHEPEDQVFVVVSSRGVRAEGDWETGGRDLRIQRTYRNQRGEVIDPKLPLVLGDLVYVELSLRNTTSETIQNVAVVDRFAAALEIENPKLGRSARTDWFNERQRWYPEHMNLRDDRIEAFGSLPPKRTVKLIYLLRAVTAGAFTAPPVEAEAMYDPTRWARERGPRLSVTGPWDE